MRLMPDMQRYYFPRLPADPTPVFFAIDMCGYFRVNADFVFCSSPPVAFSRSRCRRYHAQDAAGAFAVIFMPCPRPPFYAACFLPLFFAMPIFSLKRSPYY